MARGTPMMARRTKIVATLGPATDKKSALADLIAAGVDLSIGGLMALSGVVVIILMNAGVPVPVAIALVLMMGLAVGAINGFISVYQRTEPFIITLGMLTIVQAISRLYTKETLLVDDGPLTVLHNGGYLFGQFQITYGVAVVLISVAVLHYTLTRTSWGRHVYAVGNNDLAAKRTGINVQRVLLSVYVLAGLLYALAAQLLHDGKAR